MAVTCIQRRSRSGVWRCKRVCGWAVGAQRGGDLLLSTHVEMLGDAAARSRRNRLFHWMFRLGCSR